MTTRYVATTGSNANPGTVGSPWLTLQYALDHAVSGDTISIAAGTYAPWYSVRSSGGFYLEMTGAVIFQPTGSYSTLFEAGGPEFVGRIVGWTLGGISGDWQARNARRQWGAGILVSFCKGTGTPGSYSIQIEGGRADHNHSFGVYIADSYGVDLLGVEADKNDTGVQISRSHHIYAHNPNWHDNDQLVDEGRGGNAVVVHRSHDILIEGDDPSGYAGGLMYNNRSGSRRYSLYEADQHGFPGRDGGALELYESWNVRMTGIRGWANHNVLETGQGTSSARSDGIEVDHCVFYASDPGYAAPLFSGRTKGMVIRAAQGGKFHHLTLFGLGNESVIVQAGGEFAGSLVGAKVSNSILFGGGGGSENRCESIASGAPAGIADWNLLYNPGGILGNRVVDEANGILGSDPLFVDRATRDFRLATGSPAIDAGSDGSDMGAIPFGAPEPEVPPDDPDPDPEPEPEEPEEPETPDPPSLPMDVGLVHEYHHPDTGWTNITPWVQTVRWGEAGENAEEGSPRQIDVIVDDPDLELDFLGHRAYRMRELSSEADDDIIFSGFLNMQEISRGTGDHYHPFARTWKLSITDRNAQWIKRVVEPSDDSDRPAETDVERVAWALGTNDAGIFDDVTTYVDSTNGVDMDALDYDGQTLSSILDDCAQQSGRNWYCWYRRNGDGELEMVVWYGFTDTAAYTSLLSLTNDPADVVEADIDDGTSFVWITGDGATLTRDPSRIYSKVRVPYDGGHRTMSRDATREQFGRRETVMPAINVKSAAKAEARGREYLRRCRNQEERWKGSVVLPAAKATMIRAGMLLPLKQVHLPGYEDFVDCRVVMCAPQPINQGTEYLVNLELVAPIGLHEGEGNDGGEDDEVYAVLYAGEGPFDSAIWYGSTGDAPGAGWGASSTGHVGSTATVGPFTFASGGTPKERSPFSGIQLDGGGVNGTRIKAGFSTVGVREGFATVFYEILVNGAVVASEDSSAGPLPSPTSWGDIKTVTSDPIDLADGDFVATRVRKSGLIHMFKMPWGIGHNAEALEIIGGTIV